MRLSFPAKFTPDEDGRILITFRDFPRAVTDGGDRVEAAAEALDLLHSLLGFAMRDRETIPLPSKARRGEVMISPDLDVALKASLHIAMQRNNVTIAELTRRLEIDNKDAQRLVDPRHATRTHRMGQAIRAAGGNVAVELT